MIEVRNLTRRYGGNVAVNDLSFTVERGTICGFLGPNGAGKSTTMNIMAGYLGLTDGEVLLDGVSIADEPERCKRMIGYLPEQPPIYMDMTPEEYLDFAAELRGLERGERAEAVEDAIRLTGVEDMRDRLIANLSKGYRQRVGFAQAILGFPPILIFDEPTAGLDPKQILEIRELIRSLRREHTIILSTHILSEARGLCDKLVIVHRGNLMADGAPEELERSGGGRSLDVVVRCGDPELVRSVFAELPGVTDVSARTEDGEVFASLTRSEGEDLRERVFDACVAAGFPLLTLRPSDASLESVFIRLTSGDGPDDADGETDDETDNETDGDADDGADGDADADNTGDGGGAREDTPAREEDAEGGGGDESNL
ncbi:MAG: ABC transporter ATP-binding protein [Oscillospiraceae bacterium]|jgi:ABC-2 type transport system ATP-binding protein|nr:ABC transporter ATP-binding protein [Oscillospiraceae bacterium]